MAQLPLDGMPAPLFACTPSKLAAFADCPRRYRMTYVDRPPPRPGPPWAHNALGASVHNALCGWWDEPPACRTPARAGRLVELGWIEEGWRDHVQSRWWRARARAMVERYLADLEPHAAPRAVERQVAAKTAHIALSGRVDRLDERDGELVVVDYKTGRRELTDEDARASPALAMYAFAASRTLRQPCRAVELHHLPTGRVVAWEHDDDGLARHLRRAEAIAADALAATRALRAGRPPEEAFPARPGRLCSWCDYRRHCPDGQAVSPVRRPWDGLGEDAPDVAGGPGPGEPGTRGVGVC